MHDNELLLLGLMAAVIALNALARWLQVPHPILLVIGGLVLGLMPGVPNVELDPDLVLVLFLPPLLYGSAIFANLRDLRADACAASNTTSTWRDPAGDLAGHPQQPRG